MRGYGENVGRRGAASHIAHEFKQLGLSIEGIRRLVDFAGERGKRGGESTGSIMEELSYLIDRRNISEAIRCLVQCLDTVIKPWIELHRASHGENDELTSPDAGLDKLLRDLKEEDDRTSEGGGEEARERYFQKFREILIERDKEWSRRMVAMRLQTSRAGDAARLRLLREINGATGGAKTLRDFHTDNSQSMSLDMLEDLFPDENPFVINQDTADLKIIVPPRLGSVSLPQLPDLLTGLDNQRTSHQRNRSGRKEFGHKDCRHKDPQHTAQGSSKGEPTESQPSKTITDRIYTFHITFPQQEVVVPKRVIEKYIEQVILPRHSDLQAQLAPESTKGVEPNKALESAKGIELGKGGGSGKLAGKVNFGKEGEPRESERKSLGAGANTERQIGVVRRERRNSAPTPYSDDIPQVNIEPVT